MTWVLKLAEVYLSCNLLLAIGFLAAKALLRSSRFALVPARALLVGSVAAPLIMVFVRPIHRPVVADSVYSDMGEQVSSGEKPLSIANSIQGTVPMRSSTIPAITVLGWLLGIAMMAASSWQLARLARDASRAWKITRGAVRLRRCGRVEIVVTRDCAVPFSVRFLRRSLIVIPLSLLDDHRALAIAVAHEGQHHRQGDCVWAYVTELLRAIFVLNPAMHLWCRFFSEIQEFSCDEALVGRQHFSAHDYGCCLLRVAQAASRTDAQWWELACSPSMARPERDQPRSLLRRRIEMLSRYSAAAPRPRSFARMAMIGLIALPFGLAFAARGSIVGDHEHDGIDLSHLRPEIQKIAEQEMQTTLKRTNAKSAATLIMDPTTGHVIGFAEASSDSSQASWASRTLTPASTIKPFILAAALEAHVAAAKYDCPSPYAVGGATYTNWDGHAWNGATPSDIVAQSLNVCSIKIAQDVGPNALRAMLARFGLAPAWQDHVSDGLQLANSALGGTESTTLFGLAQAYGVLANRGRLPGVNGEKIMDEEHAQMVVGTLMDAVKHGTATRAALPNVQVAGKTGTGAFDQGPTAALFAGFAPADHPKLVAVVVVEEGRENPDSPISGGAVAAPAFREIIGQSLLINTNE